MLAAQICMVGIGIGCAYSPTLWVFAFLRFGLALFLQAGYIAGFVYSKLIPHNFVDECNRSEGCQRSWG